MSSTIGSSLKLSIFGQSHSQAIGCVIDGLPAGIDVDLERVQAFLDRRAPGRDETATTRREADTAHVVSGIVEGCTCGAPIAIIIGNTNTRSRDYDELRSVPRPGHADWPAALKYRRSNDVSGGGHFSGRLTAPLCAAGAIALQVLETLGVTVAAHIADLGPSAIADEVLDPLELRPEQLARIAANTLPAISEGAARRMREEIVDAKKDLDSVGGTIECVAYNVAAGLGDPMFDGMENRIARIVYGIPAVKSVSFGAGEGVARMRGSQNNDALCYKENGAIASRTNNAGGILGGITTGMPLIVRASVKPTPSIARQQQSVDLDARKSRTLVVKGRHDPCILPRAVPVMEAAVALAVLDAYLDDASQTKEAPAWL